MLFRSLAVGILVNLPPALLLSGAARVMVKKESAASLKLGGGIVLFPATWAVWAWVVAQRIPGVSPLLSGGSTIALGIGGGVVMILYLGWAAATLRAIRVRLTRSQRARAIQRLGRERGRMCDELLAMTAGIQLPGVVHPDGRVSRATGSGPAGP